MSSTAAANAGGTGQRVWDALRQPPGHQHRVALLAERAGTTVGTARGYLREWAAAGLLQYEGGVARLDKDAREDAPCISRDCGGKLIYVSYADDAYYTVIDRTKDARHPDVTRRAWDRGEEPPPEPDAGDDPYAEWNREPGPPAAVDTTSEPPPAGRPIAERARGVMEVLARPAATLTAVQAVQHIRACVAVSRTLFAAIETQIMEAAWQIRREYPDAQAFARFTEAQGIDEAMSSGRAWRYAETWDVVRRQRSLREMASSRPAEVVQLVSEYRDAGGEADALDEDDRRVLDVLSQPMRRRTALLREMARAQRATEAQRHPDDVARIEALEAERAAGPAGATVTLPSALVGELVTAERTLADLADRLAAWEASRGAVALSSHQTHRAALACDMAMGTLERISETVQVASAPDGAA